MRGHAGNVYMVGEKGLVLRLHEPSGRWVAVPTGYAGTLFGLVVDGTRVITYGMRGSVFASDDAGKTWQPVTTPAKAGLVSSVRLLDGDILLADQAGNLVRSRDGGRSFSSHTEGRTSAFALAQLPVGPVVAAGPRGIELLASR